MALERELSRTWLEAVRRVARPLDTTGRALDALAERLADRRFVLIGEASHGTHEFYETRAELTRRLVTRHGFDAVAVEADGPDAERVDRFVRGVGASPDRTAEDALVDFERFPRWMWRNREVVRFLEWLRADGRGREPGGRVGFHGLDLYGLRRSIRAVLDYLERVAPPAAREARELYACFDHFSGPSDDGQLYGQVTALGLAPDCEDEAVEMLVRTQRGRLEAAGSDIAAEDERFRAEENARLVKNAEAYYRTMFRGRSSSWNLRDEHMCESLEALSGHLERTRGSGKVVVWAHNSHLGDARATEMSRRGELSLGQLVRELHPDDVANIGFSTYEGTVVAATQWDEPWRMRSVRSGLPGSYEQLFHETGLDAF